MSVEWVIAKEVLEGACEILANVPPRNGIKASEYIKISKAGKDGASLTLSSDLMARAMIRTGERFPFVEDLFLDRRLFLPFVDVGKEGKTAAYKFIQKDDGSLVVRHGNRKALYEKLKPVSGYEDVPDMPGARVASLDKRWIQIVDAARDCATDDPITPNLNCVYLNPTKKFLEIYASNGSVVFSGRTSNEKSIKTSIALPLMLVDSLALDKATKLTWTNKIALIEFPKGKIWQGVKIAARKNFPVSDVREMMRAAKEDTTVLSINSTALSSTANNIASCVAALGRDSLIFAIKLEKGSRKVTIESGADASKFQEIINILEPAKADTLIEWPLEHVMPVLLYFKDDGIARIRINDNGRTSLHTKTVSLVIARKQETKAKKAKKKKE